MLDWSVWPGGDPTGDSLVMCHRPGRDLALCDEPRMAMTQITIGHLEGAWHRMGGVRSTGKREPTARPGADSVVPLADRSLPTPLILPSAGRTHAAVLILHGGRSHSNRPTSVRQLAYRRMVPIARAVHGTVRDAGVTVWLVRNRVRGWNEPAQDAVADARWALHELHRRHPAVPVVLVGHSMGGRAALRVADTEGVRAVCALAPWTEPADPVGQLADRTVLIAHGDRDRWTDPARSYAYAPGALGW